MPILRKRLRVNSTLSKFKLERDDVTVSEIKLHLAFASYQTKPNLTPIQISIGNPPYSSDYRTSSVILLIGKVVILQGVDQFHYLPFLQKQDLKCKIFPSYNR